MVPCVLNLPGQVANRIYGISLRPKPKLTSGSLSLSECGDQSCLFWYAPFSRIPYRTSVHCRDYSPMVST